MNEKGYEPGTRCLVLHVEDGAPRHVLRVGQEVTAGPGVYPPGEPTYHMSEHGRVPGRLASWCQEVGTYDGLPLVHPIIWLLPIGHDPDEGLTEDELFEKFGIKTEPVEAAIALWNLEGMTK